MSPKFEELSWQHVTALLGVVFAGLLAWVVWCFRSSQESAAGWAQAVISGAAILSGFVVLYVQGEMKRRDDFAADREAARRVCTILKAELSEVWRAIERGGIGQQLVAGDFAGFAKVSVTIGLPSLPVYEHHAIELGRISSDEDRVAIVNAHSRLTTLIVALHGHNRYIDHLRDVLAKMEQSPEVVAAIHTTRSALRDHDQRVHRRYDELREAMERVASISP